MKVCEERFDMKDYSSLCSFDNRVSPGMVASGGIKDPLKGMGQ